MKSSDHVFESVMVCVYCKRFEKDSYTHEKCLVRFRKEVCNHKNFKTRTWPPNGDEDRTCEDCGARRNWPYTEDRKWH